jgi:hypothetical protein
MGQHDRSRRDRSDPDDGSPSKRNRHQRGPAILNTPEPGTERNLVKAPIREQPPGESLRSLVDGDQRGRCE